jgi:SAM-dependent methyltransferase/4-hydroxybenzoate polyprenyltransferase
LAIGIPAFIVWSGKRKKSTKTPANHTVSDVRNFYDANTDKFLKVYGDIIQAFRTNNVKDYLDYTIHSAELKDGQKILDAGCGVGGPAAYFASQLTVDIDGITISGIQVQKSQELLAATVLQGNVRIRQGDYHKIDEIYGNEIFHRVLFLESFGHSPNQTLLIEKAFQVLKPGGILYIKDLFRREYPDETDGIKINRIIDAINSNYCYNVADLNLVLSALRRLNFILLFVKTPEIKIGEFEHLTISNDFQELFNIAKIISWEDYIFPVDFYEIKVMKPLFDTNRQRHLYYLNRPDVISQETGAGPTDIVITPKEMSQDKSVKGAFRVKDWWKSKAAFLMGLVYLFALWFSIPFLQFIPLALLSLCTIIGFASMGYLLNDLFDIRQDVLSGKKNFLAGKPPYLILAMFLLSSVFIFTPWIYLPANNFSFILIALQLSLFLVYSVPPIRLKERGTAGLMADALYAHAVPTILAAYTFSLAAGQNFPGFAMIFLFAWQFTNGLRNILLHQSEDMHADKMSGTKNFAATMSEEGFIVSIKYLIITELFFCLLFLAFLSSYNIRFYSGILTLLIFSAIVQNLFYKRGIGALLGSKWRYFPNNVYEKWFPPLFLFFLCILNKLFIIFLLSHLVLFNFIVYLWLYNKLVVLWNEIIFPAGSAIVNYPIYFSLLLFGINLKKEKTSALTYFKNKGNKNQPF